MIDALIVDGDGDGDLDTRLDNAVPLEDGYTNDVYLTEKDTVIKVYGRMPLTSLLVYITELAGLNFRYPTRQRRMEMECRTKEELADMELGVPDVVWRGETAIEFSRVQGEPLSMYIREGSPDGVRSTARKLGAIIRDVHAEGIVLKDFRLANLYIEKDRDIVSIDHEYSKLGPNFWEYRLDLLTLLSSAKHLPPRKYKVFVEGFSEGYGDIPLSVILVSKLTSPLHALVLERNLGKLRNSLKNSL